MAYTNETTHFGFPLPLGSDLTVPMDYNESLEDADTALFEAQTNAAGAVGTAGNALTVANEAKTEAQSATSAAASATATAQAAATAANEAVAAVAEAKDDALDMICAVVEETATAEYKHEPTADGLNYYFRYNDILYKTTALINVGDTIVPNTNCAATNVASELASVSGDEGLAGRVSSLETDVDALETEVDGLTNNTLGTSVDLVSYSSFSNAFVVPNDGYIKYYKAVLHIFGADAESGTATQINNTADTVAQVLFVRKGLKIVIEGSDTDRAGAYTPLL